MKLSQLVSSVFMGLVAGLLGLVVVTVVRAGVEVSHLGQDVTRPARAAKGSSNTYGRTGTDDAIAAKISEARRQDKESRRAA